MQSEREMLPCPFCKAGEMRITENKFWTGMRNDIVSVDLRHWCGESTGRLPRCTVTVTGRDRAEAIAAWNTRAAAQIGGAA